MVQGRHQLQQEQPLTYPLVLSKSCSSSSSAMQACVSSCQVWALWSKHLRQTQAASYVTLPDQRLASRQQRITNTSLTAQHPAQGAGRAAAGGRRPQHLGEEPGRLCLWLT